MHLFHKSGIREIDFDLSKSDVKSLRRDWKKVAKNIPIFPNEFKGMGIVICGGGVKYFTCAWVSIKYLRRIGCRLPIELWLIKDELTPSCIEQLSKLDVVCRNTNEYKDGFSISGWALKPFSIIKSSFEEVIFLDADNICLKNPEYLFSDIEYLKDGALFWPDYWRTAIDNPIWSILGLAYSESREQESGQMVINKKKCWTPLNLTLFFNRAKDVYYKLVFGDKDTFRFSWSALKYNYCMIEQEPATCGYIDTFGSFKGITMLQYDPIGEPCFLHRNLMKWDVTNEESFLWQKVKKFSAFSKEKSYISGYCHFNNHYFIDFLGDYEDIDFKIEFGEIESVCLGYLKSLRSKKFYLEFLLSEYIKRGYIKK